MWVKARVRFFILLIVGLLLAGCGEDAGVDQYGRQVAAERLDGQWLVINYWAQWCGPCRTEIPELNRLSETLAGRAEVFGVNYDALQGQALRDSAEAMGIRFSVLASDPAARFGLPRSEVLPVTYIVDEQGRVRERLLGEQTAQGLLRRFEALRGGE